MFLFKRICAFFICVFLGSKVFAQQEPHTMMFIYDPLSYSGAYAGVEDEVSCVMHFNKQWVNMEGSPLSFFFSGSTPVKRTGLGFGVSFSHQSIGVNERSDLEAALSYHVHLSERSLLSMSVGGECLWHAFNDRELANSEGDFLYESMSERNTSYSAQVAVLLKCNSWRVSVSANGLGDFAKKDCEYALVPHGYLSVSKNSRVDKHIELSVDAIIMGAKNSPLAFAFEPNLNYGGRWNVGLLYEIDHYVGALFKVFVCEHFYMGGAYSYALNDLEKVGASSSFELMIGFRFPTVEERLTW